MFSFLKSKKGSIEREFNWLSPEKISRDLCTDSLTPSQVAVALCRFSIFGGLDLTRSISSKKLLHKANLDKLVVEGIAYTWTHIYHAVLKSSNVDIYEDEELADAVYGCSTGLREVVNRYTEFEIAKNYIAPYLNKNLIESTEVLTGRLLSVGDVEDLGDIKDHVGTAMATNIFASTMIPAITNASINVIKMYYGDDDFVR